VAVKTGQTRRIGPEAETDQAMLTDGELIMFGNGADVACWFDHVVGGTWMMDFVTHPTEAEERDRLVGSFGL
jgi:hypothetical protein